MAGQVMNGILTWHELARFMRRAHRSYSDLVNDR